MFKVDDVKKEEEQADAKKEFLKIYEAAKSEEMSNVDWGERGAMSLRTKHANPTIDEDSLRPQSDAKQIIIIHHQVWPTRINRLNHLSSLRCTCNQLKWKCNFI